MKHKHHLGIMVHMLSNNIRRDMDDLRLKREVPMSQGKVLHFIYNNRNEKDLFQKDIELEFNLRRPSATGLLQTLESGGFIERVSKEKDKRLKKLVLTDKGAATIPGIRHDTNIIEEKLRKDISQEDLETFYQVIKQMLKNCNE